MRNCMKNERSCVLLRFKEVEVVRDLNNKLTGEKRVFYYPPVYFKANISGAKGNVFIQVFGTDEGYDKVICLSKTMFERLKIDENTVFFVDKKVEFKGTIPLYDYRVHRIAQSLNQVVIAIKKVDKQ